MANANDLIGSDTARMLIVGRPGGGKTGSIAALANRGFKIRMINFERKNYKSFLSNVEPKYLPNIDIVSLEDKMQLGARTMEPIGVPNSFDRANKLLLEWKATDKNGEPYSLGKPREWGPDTVVVVDAMTGLGRSAFLRARAMMNKTAFNTTQQVWGVAVEDQIEFIRLLCSDERSYHAVMLAHLIMVAPPMIDTEKGGPDIGEDGTENINVDIKREIAEILPTRLYPRAQTKNASQEIHKEFSSMILAENQPKNGKDGRWLVTGGRPELDLKLPALKYDMKYPISTGLGDIFEALGFPGPAPRK